MGGVKILKNEKNKQYIMFLSDHQRAVKLIVGFFKTVNTLESRPMLRRFFLFLSAATAMD